MKHIKTQQELNESKSLNISDVKNSSFEDVLKEYGKDEIIKVIYLWTPFIPSGDLEKMSNDELKFHWEQVIKNV